jgi:hypothetical protein
MVRWYSPLQLADTGARVLLSLIVESWADKREIQASLPADPPHDRSTGDDIWIDFVADLGDGWNSTYTIASLLARPELSVADGSRSFSTKRGEVLVMGGDEVYPTSRIADYENRMLGPYRAALPWSDGSNHPDLFVIPGNHDWYDGLTNFMRIFCQKRWMAGWHTHQNRSYFAIKLPHRWWLWGIDIQLDHYIDDPQIRYFQELSRKEVRSGDRLILVTAEPSWIYASRKGPMLYRNFDYFERKVVRPSGAKLTVALTGDLHHYCRFKEVGGPRQFITAGGGGAFLHPTHHLPLRLGKELKPHPDSDVPDFERASCSPTRTESIWLVLRNLLMPLVNPEFAALVGLLPILLLWSLQSSLTLGPRRLIDVIAALSYADLAAAMTRSPGSLLLTSLIVLALVGFAKAARLKRWILGLTHGFAQVCVMLGSIWLAARIVSPIPFDGLLATLLLLAVLEVVGGTAAALLFGIYFAVANLTIGAHDNEAFSALRIADYKNFLRLHIDASGALTIYPIGVRRVVRRWRLQPDGKASDPWFASTLAEPWAQLIEPPVKIESPTR